MSEEIIKFSVGERNLTRTPEYWEQDTYENRMDDIHQITIAHKGAPPSILKQPIRIGLFPILSTTTIGDLVTLASQIQRQFSISCFQIAIDRDTSTAQMLFDFLNHRTCDCVHLYPSKLKKLSVMVVSVLGLPRPEGSESWLRDFLVNEYHSDNDVFITTLKHLSHFPLGRRSYRIIKDTLTYVHHVCKGSLK